MSSWKNVEENENKNATNSNVILEFKHFAYYQLYIKSYFFSLEELRFYPIIFLHAYVMNYNIFS